MEKRKFTVIFLFEITSILVILFEIYMLDNRISDELLACAGIISLLQIAFITFNSKKNPLLFALDFFIFYFVYSVTARVYLELEELPYIFRITSVTRNELLDSAITVQLFFCAYAYTIKSNKSIDLHVFERKAAGNKYIVWICSLMCVVSPSLFYDASKGYGVRGSISSPLYEYTGLFILIGLMYTGREKENLWVLALSSGFWCLHGFFYGERAPALTAVIAWGCYLFLPKITSKSISLYSMAGIVLFSVAGAFRGISNFSTKGLYSTIQGLLRERFASDTAYYAYQAGIAIKRFENYTSLWDRIKFGIDYIAYVVLGGSIEAGNLSNIVADHQGTFHQGGGWIMFYAHFWGSAIVVLGVGIYIGIVICRSFRLKDSDDIYFNYLALYLVASTPRWFLYSPSQITRGVLIYTVMFAAFYFINMLTKGELYYTNGHTITKRRKYHTF